ncbi:MAG: hypothetical protein M0R22_03750, partial [Dehalococcoidia bacterium]|nr:hypothetical protein [Dehalococcoidia bacterium]
MAVSHNIRKPGRLLHALVLGSLLLAASGATPLAADDTTSKWSRVDTPSHDGLVVVPGSDIISFATAGPQGDTLYAIGLWYDECLEPGDYQYWADGENVRDEHLVPRLWKSEDGGRTWKDRTAQAQDAANLPAGEEFVFFSAVAAAPDDEDFVVVAGYDDDSEVMIVGSTNGADKFTSTGCADVPGEVLCLAVSNAKDDIRQIAAGTKDLDDGGRVWRLEVGGFWHGYWDDTSDDDGWLDTPAWDSLDDVFAVTSLAFSPNYDYDETILGVAIGIGFSPQLAASPMVPDPLGYGAGYYPAFHYFAGNWNDHSAWNGEAGFDGYPGVFAADPLLLFASTYYTTAWTEFFESPFLRMATDIAPPWDYTGEDAADRTALVSINGSLVPAVAGMPTAEGGYLFLMMDMAPVFELLQQDGNPFVSSVAYHGSVSLMGNAMVGLAFPQGWSSSDVRGWYESGEPALPCCSGVTVLYTDTPIGRNPCCADNWLRAQKAPTGQFNAQVAFDGDGKVAYASTQGYSYRADPDLGCYRSDESAFSLSHDWGACWNQSGIIDTDIDFIADVVVNGECGVILTATINETDSGECCDCDSVWRSEDGGESYLRVWCSALQGNYLDGGEWAVLDLPPQETDDIVTVYMADLGTETVYHATYGGLCSWESRNTGLNSVVDIAVLDDATVYALDEDGRVVKSTSRARRWSEPEDSKVTDDSGEVAHRIECHGEWVLVGGDAGDVSLSDDAGESYRLFDDIGDGMVGLAFDSYFDENGYIYAAVAGADRGMYRTTVDAADFESMNACDHDYWDVVLSDPDGNPATSDATGGVLYATYSSADCTSSGVARILNPAAATCCDSLSWDYLWADLWADAEFIARPGCLDICGCLTPETDATLYAVDRHPYYDGWDECHTKLADSDVGRLWEYTDCFAKAGPAVIGVSNGAIIPSGSCSDCGNDDFVLEWDRICDACEYDIQIAIDEGFKHIVFNTSEFANSDHDDCGSGLLACESSIGLYKPSDPCAPSLLVPRGLLDSNTTYWWRVRARFAETGEVYRSQWSAKWSFTVAVSPSGAIKLTSPDDGATNVPLQNVVFTWTSV